MSPTPRRRRIAPPDPDPFPETGLAELGLTRGDAVRFRRHEGERWKPATVARRERDGSVGLHDHKGASRAIPVDRMEVRTSGPRGGVVWEPLAARATRTEQMPLVVAPNRSQRRPTPTPTPGPGPDDRSELRGAIDPTPTSPPPLPPSSSGGRTPVPAHPDHDDDRDPGPDGQLTLL